MEISGLKNNKAHIQTGRPRLYFDKNQMEIVVKATSSNLMIAGIPSALLSGDIIILKIYIDKVGQETAVYT
jgi:hypothetical protein